MTINPTVIKAEAWVDTMPIQPTTGGTLHISLEYNGNGARGVLNKAKPQGFNQKILLLDLVYSNESIFITNPQTSEYTEELNQSNQYESIVINFEGSELTVIKNIPIIK